MLWHIFRLLNTFALVIDVLSQLHLLRVWLWSWPLPTLMATQLKQEQLRKSAPTKVGVIRALSYRAVSK